MTKSSATASPDVSVASARKKVEGWGADLAKDGVTPHDIPVDQLTAPLAALKPLIEPVAAQMTKRWTGPAALEAVAQIGKELTQETAGKTDDLRVLRKRPAKVLALLASVSALIGAQHQAIRRQARGKTLRDLASRFSPRSGNTATDLLNDIKSFLNTAKDPVVMEAFGITDDDLTDLAGAESELTTLSAEEASRGSLTDAQVTAIDAKQLMLEAFYAKLGSNAVKVYREDAAKRQAILDLIPRSAAGRSKPAEEQPPANAKDGATPAATAGKPASPTATA